MDQTATNYNPEANFADNSLCEYPVLGCTDQAATNYNPLANLDDDSCEFPINCTDATLNMSDSYGDGWNGNTLIINDLEFTISQGNAESACVSLDECMIFTSVEGGWPNEVSWELIATDSTLLASGGANYTNVLGVCDDIDEIISGPFSPAAPPITSQNIQLQEGWNLISTFIKAENSDVINLFSKIKDQLVIIKDNDGSVYLPDWDFNNINDLQIGEGYQVKTNTQTVFTIEGTYKTPEDNPITLSEGWNMFGYLRFEPSDVASVFGDIVNEIVIVKNVEGSVYLPEWGFNGIGNLEKGNGYQAKLLSDQILEYIPNDESYRLTSSKITNNGVRHFSKAPITDNNMTVIIENQAWNIVPEEGSEIAAFNNEGTLVGSASYTSPVTIITVWGDDSMTNTKEGLSVMEDVNFKLWNTNTIHCFTINKWAEGSAAYQVNAINIASSIVASTLVENTSERILVRIVNLLGQEVSMNDDQIEGVVLFEIYNDGTVEKVIR